MVSSPYLNGVSMIHSLWSKKKKKQRRKFAAFPPRSPAHTTDTFSIPIKIEMLVFLQCLWLFGEFHVYERSSSSF